MSGALGRRRRRGALRRPLAISRAARTRRSTPGRGRRRRRCGCSSTTSIPRSPSIPRSSSSTAARAGRRAATRRSRRSCATLLRLGDDETLLVQSGKPVGVFRTHRVAPRVLIANSLLVPRWATWDEFRRLEARGPDDVRPDDRRKLDLHRHAGDPAGDVPDVRGGRRAALRHAGPHRADDPDRRASAAWAARSRSRRRWPARRSSASRSTRRGSSGGSRRATSTRRRTRSTTRSSACARQRAAGRPLSVGLLGNAADVVPELAARGEHFDLVTDQTAAHDPLNGYVPPRLDVEEAADAPRARPGRVPALGARARSPRTSRAMLEFVRAGCYVFDYGNNLRGEAHEAGVTDAFTYPGFVPAYIRPLFCRGIGPFRWAALSGDPADIAAIDGELGELFPDDALLAALARARSGAGGVPGPAGADLLARLRRPRASRARDQRARPLGRGVGAGRDRSRPPRLGLGRVALPRDRGDARRLGRDRRLADPERAPQRRRGRDLGERPPRRRRRHRQLDPRGHGRRRRRHRRRGRAARARAHDRSRARGSCATPTRATRRRSTPRASTGSTCRRSRRATRDARRSRASRRLLVRDLAQVASPAGRGAPLRGASAARGRRGRGRLRPLRGAAASPRSGRCAISARSTARSRSSTAAGCRRCPGSSTATRTRASPATASTSSRCGPAARPTRSSTQRGGGILVDRPGDAGGGRARPGGRARAPRGVDARAPGRRRSRRSRATGSTATPSSRSSGRSARPAASRPGSGRTPSRPSSPSGADAYLDFLLAEVLPEAAALAEAADVFLERGAFDVGAGAPLPRRACRDAGLALRLHGDQFTEAGAIPLAIELGARSVDHLEATGDAGVAALAASDVVGVLLPASALFLGRPMPPARALVDAGAAIALATDFNPGSAFCESLPLVCSLACTQLGLTPEEALAALHRERGSRARRAPTARAGSRRASTPTSSSSRPTTGATSPTTSAGRSCTPSSEAAGWPGRPGIIDAMATRKQRRRRQRSSGTSTIVGGRGGQRARAGGAAERGEGARRPARRTARRPGAAGAAVVAAHAQARRRSSRRSCSSRSCSSRAT